MPKYPKEKNHNIYTESRVEAGLTRERAAEELQFVSADRIYRIESGASTPVPDEVLAMQRCYKNPFLCNYYCANECSIGKAQTKELDAKSLPQITLEIVDALNSLEDNKNRLIEISTDSSIQEDEMDDFMRIQGDLERIRSSFESLKIWVESKKMSGEIKDDISG